jgi:hypothetical protein
MNSSFVAGCTKLMCSAFGNRVGTPSAHVTVATPAGERR